MLWAIVGLAASGKSTFFKLMTHKGSSGKTGKGLDVAVAHVPDPRIDPLVEVFQPKKITLTEIEFADTIGAVGAGGSVFPELQCADALVLCVRAFDGGFGAPNPIADLQNLLGEFSLFELNVLERKLESIEKGFRTAKPEIKNRLEVESKMICELREHVESGAMICDLELDCARAELVSNFGMLTAKPMLILLSCDEDYFARREEFEAEIADIFPSLPVIAIMTQTELELGELDHESAEMFREEYGLTEPVIDRFVMKAFQTAGIITYFTGGDREVRSWSIEKGSTALDAAGKIHTDLARGFIRAEVVSFEQLIADGGWAEARSAGHLRLEGKDYIVQDGDVMLIKFAV
ncbi:MAG TPA: redox-regulated ATPase YchF [candidate division Zixibacteria bacterium]|nr:redox-regulated ATPase YchF [candidate division Zixibacteria bacterium]